MLWNFIFLLCAESVLSKLDFKVSIHALDFLGNRTPTRDISANYPFVVNKVILMVTGGRGEELSASNNDEESRQNDS